MPQTKALSLSIIRDQLCCILQIHSRHRFIFSKTIAKSSSTLDSVVNILLSLFTACFVFLFLHSSICLKQISYFLDEFDLLIGFLPYSNPSTSLNPHSVLYSFCHSSQDISSQTSEGLAQILHENTKDTPVSYNRTFLTPALWCGFSRECVTLWELHVGNTTLG